MFEVKKEVLEKTINYLATRPYVEVFKIISELQNSKIKKENK